MNSISCPPLEDLSSEELKEQYRSLCVERDAINKGREKLDGDRQKISSTPAEKVTGDVLAKAEAIRNREVQFHRRELELRNRFSSFMESQNLEMDKASETLRLKHEEAKERIGDELVAMGYHPFQSHTPDPHRLMPGWIMAHPTVRKLCDEYEALRNRMHSSNHRRLNEEAIVEIKKLLQQLLQQAVSV